MSCRWPVFSCSVAALLAGCASVDHKPIDPKKDVVGGNVGGIPYYEPAIYLLTYSDGNGNITAEMKVMPDQTRKMVASPFTIMSKNNLTLTYDTNKGVLTAVDSEVDATEVAKAVGETLSGLAEAAISAVAMSENAKPTEKPVPGPRLFKLVRQNDTQFVLYGSADVEPIQVTLRTKS